jgi:transcriptional regulator with XRE-family HTH domain
VSSHSDSPFKHYLRQHRLAKGMNQEVLAEKCGTFPSVISRFESGSRAISLEMAARLCRALGIKLGQLLEPPGGGEALSLDIPVKDVKPRQRADLERAIKALIAGFTRE